MTDEGAFGAAIKQLDNVWDWIAFIGGCSAGFFGHAHLGDLGFYSVPGAGLAAVGARRAGVATLRRPSLKKKSRALKSLLGNDDKNNPLNSLSRELDRSVDLWKAKLLTNDAFEQDMAAIVTKYKELSAIPLQQEPGLLPPQLKNE